MTKNHEPRPPKYPMWGQQGNFRYILNYAAVKLFNSLDESLEPEVFVVAFKMADNRFLPKIGFVPEETVCRPGDFTPLRSNISKIQKLVFVETAQHTSLLEDLKRSYSSALYEFRKKIDTRLNAITAAADRVSSARRFPLWRIT